MMTPKQEQKLLDATASTIKKQARAALDQVMAQIRKGTAPREALERVTAGFRGAYAQELAAAFSEILQASVGEKSVLGMKIGNVSLSRRFYRETSAINAAVLNLVNSHAKGFDQARDLTLKIFEGYGFKSKEVLKLHPGNPALPKYLRDELLIDPGLQGELARHFARAQALRLKTPALKAAYLEYLDAIEEGGGFDFLERKLQAAYYERMRYFANRIAQTELHRAYALTNARELLKDKDVEWVQYRMSRTHPQIDICDLYAKRDLYGMGPGIYPKGMCPLAPIHPHCRCVVAPRLDIHETAQGARRRPDADRDFLAALSDRHAAMVMGSRAKADLVLAGYDATDIFNAGTDPLYQVRPLAEAVKTHGLVVPRATRQKAAPKPAPAAPKPAATPAPAIQYWDPKTDDGKWHEASFKDAPLWVKEVVQKAGRPGGGVVSGSAREGAFYSPMADQICMAQMKPADGLREVGTWRHEYGHYVDDLLGRKANVSYTQGRKISSQAEFTRAMAEDAVQIRASSISDSATLNAYTQTSKAYQAYLGAADKGAWLKALADRLGLDLEATKRTLKDHMASTNLYPDEHIEERMVKMLISLDQGDAAGLLSWFSGGDYANMEATYNKGMLGKVADLFGAATDNTVGWGHSDTYYIQRAGWGRQAEAWANVFALEGSGDPFFQKILETFAPNMLREARRLCK